MWAIIILKVRVHSVNCDRDKRLLIVVGAVAVNNVSSVLVIVASITVDDSHALVWQRGSQLSLRVEYVALVVILPSRHTSLHCACKVIQFMGLKTARMVLLLLLLLLLILPGWHASLHGACEIIQLVGQESRMILLLLLPTVKNDAIIRSLAIIVSSGHNYASTPP